MKNSSLTITTNVCELPNKMHFDVQKNTRANIFKSKKGKGSYSRKAKNGRNYDLFSE